MSARKLMRCMLLLCMAGFSIGRPGAAWATAESTAGKTAGNAPQTVAEIYERALLAYHGGDYAAAASGFERILALPLQHADLFYNLANTYVRLGKLGPAIFNYERALRLDPGADDILFNLNTVRAQASAKVKDVLKGAEKPPWWRVFDRWFSQAGLWICVLGCWWAFFLFVFVVRCLPGGVLRSGLVATSALSLCLVIALGALLVVRDGDRREGRSAVVLADEITVREGPSQDAAKSFAIHAGLKIRVQARADGWVRVRLPNGLEGWLPPDKIGVY